MLFKLVLYTVMAAIQAVTYGGSVFALSEKVGIKAIELFQQLGGAGERKKPG